MKPVRKAVSILLAALILFASSAALCASGADLEVEYNFYPHINEVTIAGPHRYVGDFVIPEYIDGYKVTRIIGALAPGEPTYSDTLTSVTIPSTVSRIDGKAFDNCRKLTSVIFDQAPGEPLTLGKEVFAYSAVREIVLPNRISELPSDTFYFCPLQKIYIPPSVKIIRSGAFYGCNSLSEVIFADDGIETFEAGAFGPPNGAWPLKSIALPASLREIDLRNTRFESITISPDNPYFKTESDAVLSKDGKELYGVFNFSSSGICNVPEGVERVCKGALVFSPLCNIVFPEGVKYLDDESVYGRTFGLPDSLEYIGDIDLSGAVFIPKNVTYISPCAFKKLAPAAFDVDLENGRYTDFYDALYDYIDMSLVAYPANSSAAVFNVREGTKTICPKAFYRASNLKKISVPEGVIEIGESAFEHCGNLETLSLPSSLKTVGKRAFCEQDEIKSVMLDNQMTLIPERCFYNCVSLENVKLGADVETIDSYAFANCAALTYADLGGSLTSIGDFAFGGCSALTSVSDFGDKLVSIGEGAFKGTSLTSLTLPKSVTSIGADAIPKTVKLICHKNSYAHQYARANGYIYQLVTDDDIVLEDLATGIVTEIPFGATDRSVALNVAERNPGEYDWSNLAVGGTPKKIKLYDIKLTVGGRSVQPSKSVTVRVPIPFGMDVNKCKVYHVSSDPVNPLDKLPFNVVGRYMVFVADSFSDFAIVELDGAAEPAFVGVEVTPPAKTEYLLGESLDTGGMSVRAVYDDGGRLPADDYTLSGFSSGTVGTRTVTVSLTRAGVTRSAEFSVNVVTLPTPVTGVTVSPESITLAVGGTRQLAAAVKPDDAANKDVTWTSSDTAIATVSAAGLVTAAAPGAATITVKTADGNKTAACEVTVEALTVPVTGITLDKPSITTRYLPWKTIKLTAAVVPADAANKGVKWTSDDEAVATVDADGNVKTIGRGTATITATTDDGAKTASCAVTVEYRWWQRLIRLLLFGWLWY